MSNKIKINLNKKTAITSYKKQRGLHHVKGKRYGDVYWPYLPILIFTVIGSLIGFIYLASSPININSVSASALLAQTNITRQKNNLSILHYNKDLSTAAQLEANAIAIANTWSPINQFKNAALNFITTQTHGLTMPVQNLAYGFKDSGSIISAWNNSTYQSTNMLNQNLNSVGFGIINSPSFMNKSNQKIVVAIYAFNRTVPKTILSSQFSSHIDFTSTPQTIAVIKFSKFINVNSYYELSIVLSLIALIVLWLVFKHTRLLRRWIKYSEDIMINHPIIDILIVLLLIFLASGSQTIGYIS
jgi:hypothetical protein